MAIYHLSTRVNANVPPDTLLYDLCIYRMDGGKNQITLVDVTQQQIKENYETQSHMTDDIDDSPATIYIMKLTLYRKAMLDTDREDSTPFTKMYTLEALSSGKAWSPNKRENPCYFISTGITKLKSQGNTIKHIVITRPERPFIAKEYAADSLLDPFEKKVIEADLRERYNYRSYPYQNRASVCGPAAFFYCLQVDRPDVYVQAAKELWQYGKTKIGELEIVPGEGCRHPEGAFYDAYGSKISGLDWMTLAGLRDSENTVFSFDSLDSPVSGITLWKTLTEWFEKAGYEKIFSNVGITQAGIDGINDLNHYVRKGYKVVTLINDGLLSDGRDDNLTLPTHWVVWEGPVTQDANGYVHLKLFSWGKVSDQVKSQKDMRFFINRFFGGMVFKPLN